MADAAAPLHLPPRDPRDEGGAELACWTSSTSTTSISFARTVYAGTLQRPLPLPWGRAINIPLLPSWIQGRARTTRRTTVASNWWRNRPLRELNMMKVRSSNRKSSGWTTATVPPHCQQSGGREALALSRAVRCTASSVCCWTKPAASCSGKHDHRRQQDPHENQQEDRIVSTRALSSFELESSARTLPTNWPARALNNVARPRPGTPGRLPRLHVPRTWTGFHTRSPQSAWSSATSTRAKAPVPSRRRSKKLSSTGSAALELPPAEPVWLTQARLG